MSSFMESRQKSPIMRQVDWASISRSLLWSYEGSVPKDGQGLRPNHDLSAWYLQKGSVKVRTADGRTASAKEGEWMILSPGIREQIFSTDAKIISICWRARWPDGRALFDAGLPVVLPGLHFPELEKSAQLLMEYYDKWFSKDPTVIWRSRASVRVTLLTHLRGEIQLFNWLIEVAQALEQQGIHPSTHEIPDARILSALEVMETVPLRSMPSIGKIAVKTGLSESQLKRLFVRYLGHSPKAHLQERRLTEANHLVQEADLPIKEVAFLCGFSSQASFCNWFKKHEGKCPTDKFRSKTELAGA